MKAMIPEVTPGRYVSTTELFARAHRLWTFADEIYSATKYPYVSYQVLKMSPTFGDILLHIYEAGVAAASHSPEIRRLEAKLRRAQAERARLRAQLWSMGIDPDTISTPQHVSVRATPPVTVSPPQRQVSP